MPDSTRKAILDVLKPMQTVMLATCSENQPHVRPMILVYEKDRFYFASGTADAKARQIEANPLVEMCLYFERENGTGYIRATGKLVTVTDSEVRKEIHSVAKFIQNYYREPTDSGFALYQMIWKKAEFMPAGTSQTESIYW